MLKDFIFDMPIVISSIGGLFSLFFSIRNKYKNNTKLLIIFNIINILYLFIFSLGISNYLPIIVEFAILGTLPISFLGCVCFLISTIICICRRKKLNEIFKNKLRIPLFIIIIFSPIIIFSILLYKDMYLINNSEFILQYSAKGNGGLGDSYDFVYVISNQNCNEISIDVDLSYKLFKKLFLPKKLKRITKDELQNKGYKVEIEDGGIYNRYIIVYKNDKLIHKEVLNSSYFNTSLDNIFYNE